MFIIYKFFGFENWFGMVFNIVILYFYVRIPLLFVNFFSEIFFLSALRMS